MRGFIKRTFVDRGYGFLVEERTGDDYFFHCRQLPHVSDFDGLMPGQIVEFEPDPSADRRRASRVTVVGRGQGNRHV